MYVFGLGRVGSRALLHERFLEGTKIWDLARCPLFKYIHSAWFSLQVLPRTMHFLLIHVKCVRKYTCVRMYHAPGVQKEICITNTGMEAVVSAPKQQETREGVYTLL